MECGSSLLKKKVGVEISTIFASKTIPLKQLHSPANLDFFCANKMAPGVAEGILNAEHKSGKKGGSNILIKVYKKLIRFT